MNIDSSSAIRPLVAGDLPAVARIIEATKLFPAAMIDGMASAYLNNDRAQEFWLVSSDAATHDIVGFAYCAAERLTESTWNLYLIAVSPDAQRSGHGKSLIDAAERRVVEIGGRILLIETSALGSFEAKRAFFRSLGFKEEARIHDFYASSDDKVVFWKRISSAV